MTTWIMAHPWMTFILLLCCIVTIEEVIANVCKTVITWRKRAPRP